VSGSELLYDWRFTANQFVLATSPLRLTNSISFQLNSCGHSPYVTSSLTRGWVCCLQLLLAHVSAVILRSEPRGTHDPILLSYIRDFLNLEGQEEGDPVIPPGTGFPSRRLLGLTALQWRYLNPPQHGPLSMQYTVGPPYIWTRTSYKIPRPLLLRQFLLPRKCVRPRSGRIYSFHYLRSQPSCPAGLLITNLQ
jgi:hypothetical protein